jgi:ABC-type sugar transport system substrate-binding protein
MVLRKIIAAGFLSVATFFSLSISSIASAGEIVVGYAAPSLVGAQQQIFGGFRIRAVAYGGIVVCVSSGGDAQKQINDVNDFITPGVDAIVAVPEDSAGMCVAVAAAEDAGIPFYTIDRSAVGCQMEMTVLADNNLGGNQSGNAVVAHLTKKYGEPKGTVLHITGNLAQNVAQLRKAGFDEIINQHSNIEHITKDGEWQVEKGVQIVRDVLSVRDVDAIYLHSDCAYSESTVQTLKEMDQYAPRGEDGHIFIAAIDGCSSALNLIREGSTDQASGQPIPDFGSMVVVYIEKKLNGEPIEEGQVVQEGALWSPAQLVMTDVGFQLFLSTTDISIDNVDNPGLWGNQ